MLRLLFVGDIHLGKRVSGVPDDVARVHPGAVTPTTAWMRAVDYAIAERVHAVALAGDVVEQEDDFFEAYGALRQGVERLHEAGIDIVGVAGNHDVAVLPRLAAAIEPFKLLGANGTWERYSVVGDNADVADIVGWSFPAREVRVSPLTQSLPAPSEANRVSLGLLHCDRDQNRGSYAPVRSSELEGAGLDAWFLGHIHKPDALNATARPCGYLGSIAGLDVGETGAHGPWRVDIANGRLSVAPVPLAPLRWEHLDVELEADLPAAHLAGRIVARIRAFHDTLIASPIRPDVVGVRVNLTGRHHDGVALRAALANDDPTELRDDRDGTMYFVESVRLHSQPALDLRALAVGSDPAALLAQRILALRNPKSEHRRRLVAKASKAFGAIGDRPAFAALEPSALGDAELATMLERAATEALERMLSTREGGA